MALLAVAGAHLAHCVPTASGLNARSSIQLQKRDGFCKGFFAEAPLDTGISAPKKIDCEAAVAALKLNGARTWSLNLDTKQRELAVHGTCALSVWNPNAESIDIGEADLIDVIQFFTVSFPNRGYVKGSGTLWCNEDGEGNRKDLPFKLDYPDGNVNGGGLKL